MEFLASDAMNGRGSGTRDEWIAVTYVASHLRRLGLEPMGDDGGYIQTIEMERPELSAPPVLTIGAEVYPWRGDHRQRNERRYRVGTCRQAYQGDTGCSGAACDHPAAAKPVRSSLPPR